MEEFKYKKLKDIKLEKAGIIKKSMNDPVYKFCVLNKIDNLGDFVKIYKNERANMDGRYSFCYFDGVIDLINLVFLKDKLPEAYHLNKMIKIWESSLSNNIEAYVESDVGFTVGRTENKTLKRLGFNNKESKKILSQVISLGKEVTIIDAIKACIENFDFKNMNFDDEMFITKLHIMTQYYDNHKEEIKSVKYEEVEKQADELYMRMLLLQRELVKVYIELEKTLGDLPKNDERSKTLIRKFRQFNCK